MVKLGLTYDTGAEKMKQALEVLRAIPAKIKDVSRKSVGRHGLLLGLHRLGAGRHVLLLHREAGRRPKTTSDVNLEILDSFAKAGLTFAFPTRTLLVHQDDAEKPAANPAAADGTQIQNS